MLSISEFEDMFSFHGMPGNKGHDTEVASSVGGSGARRGNVPAQPRDVP